MIDLKKTPNIKILIPSPEISVKVQRELFKLGIRWGSNKTEPEYTSAGALYVEDGRKLLHSSASYYHKEESSTPVNWQDIVSDIPEGGFQVGDKVSAYGVEGEIYGDDKTNYLPLFVRFPEFNEGLTFERDGKKSKWHKEPTLKFISRPPKKELRSFYIWTLDGVAQTTLMDNQHRDIKGNVLKMPAGELKKIEGTEVKFQVEIR